MKACWPSMKKEMQDELVKFKGSGTSTTTDAPRGEEGTFWLNTKSGMAHGQRCILDEGPPRLFRARCAWQARESDAAVCVDVLPASHKSLCERRFPELRRQCKRRMELRRHTWRRRVTKRKGSGSGWGCVFEEGSARLR